MSVVRDNVIEKMTQARQDYIALYPTVKRQMNEELILLILAMTFIFAGIALKWPLIVVGYLTMLAHAFWRYKGSKIRSKHDALLNEADILQAALKIADQIVYEEKGLNG